VSSAACELLCLAVQICTNCCACWCRNPALAPAVPCLLRTQPHMQRLVQAAGSLGACCRLELQHMGCICSRMHSRCLVHMQHLMQAAGLLRGAAASPGTCCHLELQSSPRHACSRCATPLQDSSSSSTRCSKCAYVVNSYCFSRAELGTKQHTCRSLLLLLPQQRPLLQTLLHTWNDELAKPLLMPASPCAGGTCNQLDVMKLTEYEAVGLHVSLPW
jgi:hypothetical protein